MSTRKRCTILLTAIFSFLLTIWSLYESFNKPPRLRSVDQSQICTRDPGTSYFQGQFSNPAGVLSVLLLVGGDTVQKAVAQMTGDRDDVFTPAVFSFGWVSYAVSMVATAFGEAVFLPVPEHSGYVVNVGSVQNGEEALASGDRRENRSWRLGRLIRDLELSVKDEAAKFKSGLYVTVYRLNPGTGRLHPKKDKLWWIFSWAIPVQLGLASVPLATHGDWSILVITVTGNILALLTASLPSMRKLEYRSQSQQTYALTRGNGYRHVFIIRPNKYGTEEIEFGLGGDEIRSKLPYLDEMAVNRTKPVGKTTRALTFLYAALWIMLLVAVGGLESGTWYLLGVGTIGMVLNIVISSRRRDPAAYGLPVKQEKNFGFAKFPDDKRMRTKDVLLELEKDYPGAGHALRPLFFTSSLPNKHQKDEEWGWKDYSWEGAGERLERKGHRAAPNNQAQPGVANQTQPEAAIHAHTGATNTAQPEAANQAQPEDIPMQNLS